MKTIIYFETSEQTGPYTWKVRRNMLEVTGETTIAQILEKVDIKKVNAGMLEIHFSEDLKTVKL